MFKKPQVIAAGLIVILLSAAVSYAVAASVPAALLPAGTTRYAVAQQANMLNIGAAGTWKSTLLSTSVSIPTGKSADVTVLFCSAANAYGGFINVRAKVGSTLLVPTGSGSGTVLTADAVTGTHCVNFYKTGVSAGTKTVKVEWYAGTSSPDLYERNMVVTLNIH